jgi:hypothetical protein
MVTPTLPHDTETAQAPRLAAIYARVSTAEQADRGFSLPTQIAACQELAAQLALTVPEGHVFVDDYTGMSLNRPQFSRLRELVEEKQIVAVVVHDTDRLSRKLAHQLLLTEAFEQAGVALHIVTMPDGAKTPEHQLLSNMRGSSPNMNAPKSSNAPPVDGEAEPRPGMCPMAAAPSAMTITGPRPLARTCLARPG